MGTVRVFVLLLAGVFCCVLPCGSSAGQGGEDAAVSPAGIAVTIATGGGLHGHVRSRFKVGEEIPVVVTLTNTGGEPVQYCLSTTIFQNRPRLERDGQPMPYLTNLPTRTEQEDAVELCEKRAFKRVYELKPKEKKVVDWLTFGRGITWYNPLPPGHYELVLMRRMECCLGPMVESNRVAFDIVP